MRIVNLAVLATVMLSAVNNLCAQSNGPTPVAIPHFPDTVHAVVWRNWGLIPAGRIASVVGAKQTDITAMAKRMGLPREPPITPDFEKRTYLTVIRRNWHLLPNNQLIKLLGWTPEKLAYTLKEDDFLYIKLGSLKPNAPQVSYVPPIEQTLQREKEIAAITEECLKGVRGLERDEPLAFVKRLSAIPKSSITEPKSIFNPRFCYSYFATYGDPLLPGQPDPYPEGYLARLKASGVNGVWLQGVLYKLAPFPWDPKLSEGYQQRLKGLKALVARAKRQGIGVYLYLNEPRTVDARLAEKFPELSGVREGDQVALCTSTPQVRKYISNSVEQICRAVPDLAGFFTITASENLTNCWSHGQGLNCSRCKLRKPAEVIAEVNAVIQDGINRSGAPTRLIAWDWGWNNDWAPDAIRMLPPKVALMSVSEWDLPISRGGVRSNVGEYSLSSVGPGPRAPRHWQIAKETPGRAAIAKVQANTTWELSTVPFIPAVYLAAQHAVNVRNSGVSGLMLGWTLGGYPSPNLDAFSIAGSQPNLNVNAIVHEIAVKRGGAQLAPILEKYWREISTAFSEYPYSGDVLYNSPVQLGPANLLWDRPSKYHATMTGFPYDDSRGWRGPYSEEIFADQMKKVANGFNQAVENARRTAMTTRISKDQWRVLSDQLNLGTAAAIHFMSVANQTLYIQARDAGVGDKTSVARLRDILSSEEQLAKELLKLQWKDSRLGFEAANQYAYVWQDLVEKVLNSRDLAQNLANNR